LKPRDVRVYLQNMATAADAIGGFVAGRTLDDYNADLMLRSAVERQLEILGEALARALHLDPGLQERLPASRGAIDFRNVIAHEYDALSAATVWDIARNELPALAADAAAELARLEASERPG
jgi:uncharacterized protein with HEPN domain